MISIKTVLCPVDFSPITSKVLGLAIQVSQLFSSRLILHHSNENGLLTQEVPNEGGDFHVDKSLKEMIARAPDSIHVESRITTGHAHKSVLELARSLPADLIVMGTHGRSGVRDTLLGSTTERVITESLCPVLTAHDIGHNMILPERGDPALEGHAQVLVPLDLFPHSSQTLEHALGLLEMLPIDLHLLHVIEPTSVDDTRGATHFNVPEFLHLRTQDARDSLRALIPAGYENRVHVHARVGPVVRVVLDYAAQIDARLIVMGITRKNFLKHLLLGAPAYGVLRGSACPVWIVPGSGLTAGAAVTDDLEFAGFPPPCKS
jgi:nucleotide-binding universal stress UspA family protein